jgi:hypothetical protein
MYSCNQTPRTGDPARCHISPVPRVVDSLSPSFPCFLVLHLHYGRLKLLAIFKGGWSANKVRISQIRKLAYLKKFSDLRTKSFCNLRTSASPKRIFPNSNLYNKNVYKDDFWGYFEKGLFSILWKFADLRFAD